MKCVKREEEEDGKKRRGGKRADDVLSFVFVTLCCIFCYFKFFLSLF